MPYFREIFSVGVKNPRGDRLSFQKVVNFLFWLRRSGFNIFVISTDQYQSSYLREILSAQGFNTTKISVDRTEDPYVGLRNILYDQRIELVKNDVRDTELVRLQRIGNKIDHPSDGSKDLADCLCGACWDLTVEHVPPSAPTTNIANAISKINGINSKSNLGPSMFGRSIKRY